LAADKKMLLFSTNDMGESMFMTIERWQFKQYPELLEQMYRLRAAVFKDQLDWEVTVADGKERDEYDALNPIYLVWCDSARRRLYGSLRMLPTTGPTLLYDVFRETFPRNIDLVSPEIWEGTRLCVDENAIAADYPGMAPSRSFCIMLLALCETALASGIHTMISNYEPPMLRLYRMAGARIEVLGKADKFGKRPVCAGAFEVGHGVLEAMRDKIGMPCSLFLPLHENWLAKPLVGASGFKAKPAAPVPDTWQMDKAAAQGLAG
jgi:acyl homoserine lactone synthase